MLLLQKSIQFDKKRQNMQKQNDIIPLEYFPIRYEKIKIAKYVFIQEK